MSLFSGATQISQSSEQNKVVFNRNLFSTHEPTLNNGFSMSFWLNLKGDFD
jgi:hypothetical protein